MPNNSLQELITVSCPVIYGSNSWPLYFLYSSYFICFLASSYRIIAEIRKRKNKYNFMKISCLIFLSLFLLIKSLFYIVPFPLTVFSNIFFCDQLARFFLFISFIFLSLWLGGVVFNGVANFCCGFFFYLK
jgi:hypothetical protein